MVALDRLCCVLALSSCSERGLLSSCGAQASHCGGLLMLWNTGSRLPGFGICGSRAAELRLSSCGAWAQLPCSMWACGLPRPGIVHVSPALAGRFFTTGSSGKSATVSF